MPNEIKNRKPNQNDISPGHILYSIETKGNRTAKPTSGSINHS